jgi:hypothetical protein
MTIYDQNRDPRGPLISPVGRGSLANRPCPEVVVGLPCAKHRDGIPASVSWQGRCPKQSKRASEFFPYSLREVELMIAIGIGHRDVEMNRADRLSPGEKRHNDPGAELTKLRPVCTALLIRPLTPDNDPAPRPLDLCGQGS